MMTGKIVYRKMKKLFREPYDIRDLLGEDRVICYRFYGIKIEDVGAELPTVFGNYLNEDGDPRFRFIASYLKVGDKFIHNGKEFVVVENRVIEGKKKKSDYMLFVAIRNRFF